jgi:hypothetical protein
MKAPKILIYDIETTPNLGYVWGKYEQNVLAYKSQRELLSVAYKWYGQKEVYCITRKGQQTDLALVRKVRGLLQEAAVTVAHNGDQFDRKILKTRMFFHQLAPIKVNCSVDTRTAARAYFGFNGNSLDDLCQFRSLGKKMPTPGISLWLDCMANKDAAWRTMIKYNKHDVVLLDKLYTEMRPWIENHPNMSKLLDPSGDKLRCPLCTSLDISKYGIRVTGGSKQQRWICKDCGRNFLTSYKK